MMRRANDVLDNESDNGKGDSAANGYRPLAELLPVYESDKGTYCAKHSAKGVIALRISHHLASTMEDVRGEKIVARGFNFFVEVKEPRQGSALRAICEEEWNFRITGIPCWTWGLVIILTSTN